MSRPTLRRLTAVLLIAAIAATGCSDDDSSASDATTTTAKATFPVTVTADNGRVEIAAAPKRIVSLSPSLTEMLYAMGAGQQVVAVDKYSNYPAGTPVTDLSGFKPNVESIGGYQPDLVVLSGDREGIVAALQALSIPTLVLPAAKALDDVYGQLGVLGTATGHKGDAKHVSDQIKSDLHDIAQDVPKNGPKTYFYELSNELHSATSDTFIGGLLKLVGLTSIADDAPDTAGGYPQLTAEFILDANPDVIFLADTTGTGIDPATVVARPGWSNITAVKEGRVIVLPDDLATRWGPRIVDLLRSVVLAITPGATTTTAATG